MLLLKFDGWLVEPKCVVAIFALHLMKMSKVMDILLCFSIFEDEANHMANEHLRKVQYILEFYLKPWRCFVVIVDDN